MKKHLKISLNAPLVLGFVFLCFLATLFGIVTRGAATNAYFTTYHSSLKNPMTYVRFFTHVFGHSGWDHFIGNASYLLLLGPILEEKYGAAKMLWVISFTALVTALINYFLFPGVGLCGASGVVFAFILLTSFTGFKNGEIPMTFLLVAIIYLGQQVYEGILFRDNISQFSHIIGGVVGAVIGYNLNRGIKG